MFLTVGSISGAYRIISTKNIDKQRSVTSNISEAGNGYIIRTINFLMSSVDMKTTGIVYEKLLAVEKRYRNKPHHTIKKSITCSVLSPHSQLHRSSLKFQYNNLFH